MPTGSRGRAPRVAAFAGVLALLLVGCSDEKIVFREPFNPPPDANSGFLGYFTATDKQTTCGNCHVTHQATWQNTAHASAYEALAAIGQRPRLDDLAAEPNDEAAGRSGRLDHRLDDHA